MRIVTARMHPPSELGSEPFIARPMLLVASFFHGERVHIEAERQDWPTLTATPLGNNASESFTESRDPLWAGTATERFRSRLCVHLGSRNIQTCSGVHHVTADAQLNARQSLEFRAQQRGSSILEKSQLGISVQVAAPVHESSITVVAHLAPSTLTSRRRTAGTMSSSMPHAIAAMSAC